MCNDFRNRIPLDHLREGFPGLETPGGAPNLEPREEITITETAPIIARGRKDCVWSSCAGAGLGRAARPSTTSAQRDGV